MAAKAIRAVGKVIKDTTKFLKDSGKGELANDLWNLETEMKNLVVENQKLQDENKKLHEVIDNVKVKEFRDNCYYFDGEGPFCSTCYDVRRIKVRMVERNNNAGSIYNRCPECKNEVFKCETDGPVYYV
ncbi:hypothetical protein INP51_13960 [Blautia liquoris]|jgi:regulator of replication initiation timing|uniref:Uncharacterized protein n=1 Tax=Blautia liquoris TaxID=2779518 RepID=A0A7M2RF04_9FIRM|nr:hypothetical protein [Blautia liquoris]QOV18925.1 hypothetical protein INP51_13165 [Blautia liquoris]QOV19046.1 hypothetical protein INP51_13960 [Blautia liquoris]